MKSLRLALWLACAVLPLACCPPRARAPAAQASSDQAQASSGLARTPSAAPAAAPRETAADLPAACPGATPNERTLAAVRAVLERAALDELGVFYGPSWPEVVTHQATLQALQAREAELAAAGEPLDTAASQCAISAGTVETRASLAEQETGLGPEHPEVQRLRARLRSLEDAAAAIAAPASPEE